MSDKEDMIMLILNNLGKEITFDRNIIYDIIEKSTSDYQIKYISNEILTLDTNERIESYFAAEDSSKIEYECRRFLN